MTAAEKLLDPGLDPRDPEWHGWRRLRDRRLTSLLGLLLAIAGVSEGFGSVVVQYNLAGSLGNQATNIGIAPDLGVTAADLARGISLAGATGLNSMNTSGWRGGGARNINFGFTVDASTSVSLDTITLQTRSSADGPGILALFSSLDGFNTPLYTFDQSSTAGGVGALDSTIDLSGVAALQGITDLAVEFRIERTGKNAADGSKKIDRDGEFGVSNFGTTGAIPGTAFTIEGTIAPVPEISSPLVVLALMAIGVLGHRRRH